MRKVIDFIMKQEVETIDKLPSLAMPINKNFKIKTSDGKHRGLKAAKMLMATVVNWEEHTEIPDSLESILDKQFCLAE